MQPIDWRRALFTGLFTLAVLLLGGFGVVAVARRHWQWQETFTARAAFPSIGGVAPGAAVLVQGIDAGVVEAVVPPTQPGGQVTLKLRLDIGLRHLVRADALARIVTQGVVGAKVVEIVPGQPDAPPLAPGQAIAAEPPVELADLLDRAQVSLQRLDDVSIAAREGLGEINAIAGSIRRGEGTLGRLVQDEEAYTRLMDLSQRGESTLVDLQENLDALKGIWPISGYFKARGFSDADRLLYQPGAEQERRVFVEADLFTPGRAVLTEAGRNRLDEVAAWFLGQERPPTAEIVIAAFTDEAPSGSQDLARVLTQEQADAVRTYLVDRHRIDSLPWYTFSRRKVAAVGYGNEPPQAPGYEPGSNVPRRVEFIVFAPRQSG